MDLPEYGMVFSTGITEIEFKNFEKPLL